jgi:imidazolonepropionase
MTKADLVLYNVGSLYTGAGPVPRRGLALRRIQVVERAAIASFEGRIVFVGPEANLNGEVALSPETLALDARGRAVVPGFVDAHTHAVYAGDRLSEFRERLAGASYQEVAARGGGILSTVRQTREASRDELVESALPRLDRMLAHGTTTVECKSGYGLEPKTERVMLEAMRRLASVHPIDLVATFLGAHEVPPEHRETRERYVELLCHQMIPEVARSNLAEWCDVFCERGVFSVEESRLILGTAREHQLKLRLHADEFAPSGGAELAVELGARSADHLMNVSQEGIRALARSEVAATLLPIASFYLRQPYAPARKLVEEGAVVALGTDVNPGGGLSPSMPFAIALACLGAGLLLEEALHAATINAAYALDRAGQVGSLEVGKNMDAVVLAEREPACLLQMESGVVESVIKSGKLVVEGGRLSRRLQKGEKARPYAAAP